MVIALLLIALFSFVVAVKLARDFLKTHPKALILLFAGLLFLLLLSLTPDGWSLLLVLGLAGIPFFILAVHVLAMIRFYRPAFQEHDEAALFWFSASALAFATILACWIWMGVLLPMNPRT